MEQITCCSHHYSKSYGCYVNKKYIGVFINVYNDQDKKRHIHTIREGQICTFIHVDCVFSKELYGNDIKKCHKDCEMGHHLITPAMLIKKVNFNNSKKDIIALNESFITIKADLLCHDRTLFVVDKYVMICDNNNQPRYAVLYCTGCHKSFKIKFPDGFDGHGYDSDDEPDFEYF